MFKTAPLSQGGLYADRACWFGDGEVVMVGEGLDEVFRSGDPAEMADRLEAWQREFDKQADGFEKVQRAAADLQVTETGANGGVRVTVDVNGKIVDITTTAALDEVRSEEIGPAIMACLRRAQSTLVARFAETARETLGDGDPVGENLVGQYQQRFPDAEPLEPPPAPPRTDEEAADAPIRWEEM
jgi:DNA-binding protein YbaB